MTYHDFDMTSTNSAIDYYDIIAESYDQMMRDDEPNVKVREAVRTYFCQSVPQGKILDFGAGTGLDLEWQLSAGYEVIFYEPSANMASQAEKSLGISKRPGVSTIVGKKADLEHIGMLPDASLEAVFSNFAALNSVEHLKETFAVFASKLKPGGHLICVLTNNFDKVSRLKSVFSDLAGSQAAISKKVEYTKGQSMHVFYHSGRSLRRAAANSGLRFEQSIQLDFEKHELTHFIKY